MRVTSRIIAVLAPGTGSLVIMTATTTRFGGIFDVILPPSNGSLAMRGTTIPAPSGRT